MKSILYQLQKYRQKKEEPAIELKDDNLPDNAVTMYQLALNIARAQMKYSAASKWSRYTNDKQFVVDETERLARQIEKLCKDLPIFECSDRLYPLEVLCVYHCFYTHKTQVVNEQVVDAFIKDFMMGIDIREYYRLFDGSASKPAKRITMARVMLATYGCGESKLDVLPEVPFRKKAATYLGIPETISGAARIQDSLHNTASIEDIIIGRLGYLMIWHWWDKGNDDDRKAAADVPLLTK